MRIGQRIFIGFFIVVALFSMSTYFAMSAAGNVGTRYKQLTDETIPCIEALEDIRFAILEIVSSASVFGAAGPDSMTAISEKTIGEEVVYFERSFSRYEKLVNKYFPDEKDILEEMKLTTGELLREARELIRLRKAGAPERDILVSKTNFEKDRKDFLKAFSVAIEHENVEIAERKEVILSAIARTKRAILMTSCFSFFLVIAFGAVITRSITRPIAGFIEATNEIGQGNLDKNIDIASNDEIGELAKRFNGMTAKLKESRIEIENRNAELQQRIDERLRAEEANRVLQDQLLQSQKMEAIGQLAGGIAHDFNNMLAVIMGNADLALSDMKPEDANHLEFTEIAKASERAKDLTMKLLTFSRKEKIEIRNIRISKVIGELGAMLDRTLPKTIKIETIINDDLMVNIDVNQIQQALLNICVNASDAMPDGGSLIIKCGEMEIEEKMCGMCGKGIEGRYCGIQISDTGIGISEKIINRITEPFFTTKGMGKGTGLGLSVTHGIIQNHNGHMRIYSRPGAGACVTVYLPVSEILKETMIAEAARQISRGTETILAVDDEESILSMVGNMLEVNGYTPVLAASGAEAVALYGEHKDKIAAVILDMMMPEMNGRDVYRKLKEMNPGIKVILASGYSIDGQAGELMKEGIQCFLQKPFTMSSLCGAVRKLLDE